MIEFKTDDKNIETIEIMCKRFVSIKRENTVHVYGASNRDHHDKYCVYVTGYKDITKLKKRLSDKGFTLYGEGVGVYEKKKNTISVGLNKNIRQDHPEVCAKIAWVVHATS